MADQWVQGKYILDHLRALLAMFPLLMDHNPSSSTIDGVIEWTLPLGFDDGESFTRLTIIGVPVEWKKPRRVQVAVAMVSARFGSVLELPRFSVDDVRHLTRFKYNNVAESNLQADPIATHTLAGYLLAQVQGDTDSLHMDAKGYWSFNVIVADS